jgi:hypothetical protein
MVEEAGCQECEKLPPSERVCWEVVFRQRESITSFRALRIPDLTCFRDPEREVKQTMDCVTVKVYTPGWNGKVGNESPWVVGIRRFLERILLVAFWSFL